MTRFGQSFPSSGHFDALSKEALFTLAAPSTPTARRAIHIAERKRLYEDMHPETKFGGDRKSDKIKSQSLRPDQPARFTADTAKKTGTSERKVQSRRNATSNEC